MVTQIHNDILTCRYYSSVYLIFHLPLSSREKQTSLPYSTLLKIENKGIRGGNEEAFKATKRAWKQVKTNLNDKK
jgi:hypothetical protein